MKLTLLTVFTGLLALAVASPAGNAPANAPATDGNGECHFNGCRCRQGTHPGEYCGWSEEVVHLGHGGSYDHNYECNRDGECCDYGHARHCEKHTAN